MTRERREKMDPFEDELFKLREAAEFLKTSVPNMKRMIYAGKITASKVGCQWRIRKSELISYLEVNSTGRGGK